jgi:hypothetical protein
VSENQIGVKLADGSFYPVLERDFAGRKKLVVTTARDNQQTVQIDLFRGREGRADQARFIGSLVIENIHPAPMREPEIELELGLDPQGNLDATASDPLSGERQSLSVSLPSIEGVSEEGGELPPLTEAAKAGPEAEAFEESLLTGETYPIGSTDRRKERLERRRVRPLALIGFILLGLIVIAGAAYLLWRLLDGRPIPALFGGGNSASLVSEQAAQPESPPEVSPAQPQEATASGTGEATSAAQPEAKPAPAPTPSAEGTEAGSEGVWYRIKWGDTLWDLAATYYRNPWLYPRLAKANKIPNPDLIIAGRRLFIPKL